MMKKIYIVTAGCYSSYHIDRVFSTKEAADKYVNTFTSWDGHEVEEFNIDETVDYSNLYVDFSFSNINNKHYKREGIDIGRIMSFSNKADYHFEVSEISQDDCFDIDDSWIRMKRKCSMGQMLHYKKNGDKILSDLYTQYLSLIELEGFSHEQALESLRKNL